MVLPPTSRVPSPTLVSELGASVWEMRPLRVRLAPASTPTLCETSVFRFVPPIVVGKFGLMNVQGYVGRRNRLQADRALELHVAGHGAERALAADAGAGDGDRFARASRPGGVEEIGHNRHGGCAGGDGDVARVVHQRHRRLVHAGQRAAERDGIAPCVVAGHGDVARRRAGVQLDGIHRARAQVIEQRRLVGAVHGVRVGVLVGEGHLVAAGVVAHDQGVAHADRGQRLQGRLELGRRGVPVDRGEGALEADRPRAGGVDRRDGLHLVVGAPAAVGAALAGDGHRGRGAGRKVRQVEGQRAVGNVHHPGVALEGQGEPALAVVAGSR